MPPRQTNVTWVGEGPATFSYTYTPSGFTTRGLTYLQQQRMARETRRSMNTIRAQERQFIREQERQRREREQRRRQQLELQGAFPTYPGRPGPPPPPHGGRLTMPVIR
jgi:hypothetical protein